MSATSQNGSEQLFEWKVKTKALDDFLCFDKKHPYLGSLAKSEEKMCGKKCHKNITRKDDTLGSA